MSDSGTIDPASWIGRIVGDPTASGVSPQLFLLAVQEITRAIKAQTQVISPFGLVTLVAGGTPPTPPAGQFYIYMDVADGKIKAIGPNGTITDIANP